MDGDCAWGSLGHDELPAITDEQELPALVVVIECHLHGFQCHIRVQVNEFPMRFAFSDHDLIVFVSECCLKLVDCLLADEANKLFSLQVHLEIFFFIGVLEISFIIMMLFVYIFSN